MPAYSLDDLRRIVRAWKAAGGASGTGGAAGSLPPEPVFTFRKSLDVVADRLDMTPAEAKSFVYDALLALTDPDYCETSPDPAPPADVYGIALRRIGWYIKFKILPGDRLHVCGFHPPERPLRTKGGETVR